MVGLRLECMRMRCEQLVRLRRRGTKRLFQAWTRSVADLRKVGLKLIQRHCLAGEPGQGGRRGSAS
jgi:hypothetical protein